MLVSGILYRKNLDTWRSFDSTPRLKIRGGVPDQKQFLVEVWASGGVTPDETLVKAASMSRETGVVGERTNILKACDPIQISPTRQEFGMHVLHCIRGRPERTAPAYNVIQSSRLMTAKYGLANWTAANGVLLFWTSLEFVGDDMLGQAHTAATKTPVVREAQAASKTLTAIQMLPKTNTTALGLRWGGVGEPMNEQRNPPHRLWLTCSRVLWITQNTPSRL
jgi:hypothetical protein